MPTTLEYENARIRNFRRELLSREFVEAFIDVATPEEASQMLGGTVYHDDVAEAVLTTTGWAGLEEGLKRNISRTFQRIISFTSAEALPYVRQIFGRFDVFSVKTVLRGKHVGASVDEIREGLLAAGELSDALLLRLAEQPDVRGVIDLLGTWLHPFARPLRRVLPEYERDLRLLDLELALDRHYYEQGKEVTTGADRDMNASALHAYLALEVDFTNILTAFRLSREGVEVDMAEQFFIHGGKRVTVHVFDELCALKSAADIAERFAKTPYWDPLEKGLVDHARTGMLSALERRLEEHVALVATRLSRLDPLSVGLIISYAWAKYNEGTNLRVVIRGKAVRMPEERIKEALVFV